MKIKLLVIIDDETIDGQYTMYIGKNKFNGLKYGSDTVEGIAECFADYIRNDTKIGIETKENK